MSDLAAPALALPPERAWAKLRAGPRMGSAPMPERLVATAFLRPIAARIRELRGDPRAIAARLGILNPRDQRVEPWVSPEAVRRFCALAAEETGDTELGVHAALGRPAGSFGLVEFGARSAGTVGAALGFLARASPLLKDGFVSTLHVDRHEARFGFSFPGDPEGLGRHAHEYKLVALFQLIRQAAEPRLRPRRAWFAHHAPREIRALGAALGGAELEFGRRDNGFALDAALLESPPRTADAALFAYLDQQTTQGLAELREAPVPGFFRERLEQLIQGGAPSLARLAKVLHMSPRTLQRRLEAAGTTFHDVLDDARQDLARRELDQTQRSVAEIARQLGYQNPRSFIRAFHRWTGTTPARYRRRHDALD